MTTDEFLEELERVHSQFEWTLAPYTPPAAESDQRPRLCLRAIPKTSPPNGALDPIAAVCYARTGRVYEPESWPYAGESLGMIPSDSAIIFAASDCISARSDGDPTALDALEVLRARLIKSVGLQLRRN